MTKKALKERQAFRVLKHLPDVQGGVWQASLSNYYESGLSRVEQAFPLTARPNWYRLHHESPLVSSINPSPGVILTPVRRERSCPKVDEDVRLPVSVMRYSSECTCEKEKERERASRLDGWQRKPFVPHPVIILQYSL